MITILKKIIHFSKEQRKNLCIGIFIGFLKALFAIANVVAISFVIKSIIDKTLDQSVIINSISIMAIGLTGSILCTYFSTMRLTNAGYFMAANSRMKIGDHLKNMSMGYFNANNLGKITSVATNSCNVLNELLTRSIMLLAQGIFMSLVITLAMFYMDIKMGFICLFGIVLYFIMTSYQQSKSKKVSKENIYSTQVLVGNILEYIQGISVVKSYNLVGDSNKKVKDSITKSRETFFNLEKTFIPITFMQSFVFKMISFIMIYVAITSYINSQMGLFEAVMISICAFLIFADLEQASMFGSLLRLIEASIDEVNEILNTPVMDEKSKEVSINNYDIEIKDI